MKQALIAIGKIKRGVFQDLYRTYESRLRIPLSLKEIEVRELSETLRIKNEGEQILKALRPDAYVVALDEKGVQMTSQDFAELLASLQTKSCKEIAFVIGGAFGLGEGVLKRANICLAFGTLTWPHLLVRSLLVEQLYRAQQILAGHPYHKES